MADNRHADEFANLLKDYRAAKLKIIQHAAVMAVSHFKASFVNQGFTDNALVKWTERKGGIRHRGRAIGMQRGVLKRSIRIKRTSLAGAVVSVDDAVPYADIFNFGGQIKITTKMRRFFWAMYYKHGGGQKNKNGKPKALNETAQFYKNLALTKADHITIPARKFIGTSAQLERNLKSYISGELDKLFKID